MDEAAAITMRPFERRDLPAALALQAQSYPPFLLEDEAAFASRLALPDAVCLVAARGETLLAYLLAHGWPREAPPAIGTALKSGAASDILFIHDLAVSAAARGSGIGWKLVRRAFELAAAKGLRRAELIAVEGAASYWRGLGFDESAVSGALAAKIATYGPEARWMTRRIP